MVCRHAWRKRSISDVVPQRIVNAEVFLRKQLELLDPETDEPVRKLKPGTRAYRYSFTLPGDISESIEGLPGQCVEYDLKAFAERPLLSSRLEAKYHLRIVRTLGTSMQDELLDRQEVSYFHYLNVVSDSFHVEKYAKSAEDLETSQSNSPPNGRVLTSL